MSSKLGIGCSFILFLNHIANLKTKMKKNDWVFLSFICCLGLRNGYSIWKFYCFTKGLANVFLSHNLPLLILVSGNHLWPARCFGIFVST